MKAWVLLTFALAFVLVVNGQSVKRLIPGIQEAILSNPDFSRFTEILLSDFEKLPIDSSTSLFVPTNRALTDVAGLDNLLQTSDLHRLHFLATHFIKGSETLGLEQIRWTPSNHWIQTPRFEWILAKRVEFSGTKAERLFVVDRPILPYWCDYVNVTTSIQQFNAQTSSLLMAEKIAVGVPFDHTFLAPMDEAFPMSSLHLLSAFPGVAQYFSSRLSLEGILGYDSSLGAVATVAGSFIDFERTKDGISFDGNSRATDFMLVQRGLVYVINKLPASLMSMDFLLVQYSAFPEFRTYFVPTSKGLDDSAFYAYLQNVTSFATHINKFAGYHTTAIPSHWISSSPVSLPMADRSMLDILPLDDVLYIRSSDGFLSRTITRISSNLMVLNRFLTPQWMQRDNTLQYIQSAAPHFTLCISTLTEDALPEEITVFVPTQVDTELLNSKNTKAICRNHFLPYVVNAESKTLVQKAAGALSSGGANVISFSLTTFGVVYQVDRLLLPYPYSVLADPPKTTTMIRLFDHVIN